MASKAYWEHGANDMGPYVQCSSCNHKIAVLDFLIADASTSTCSFCNKEMSFERIDYDRLLQEAAHGRE